MNPHSVGQRATRPQPAGHTRNRRSFHALILLLFACVAFSCAQVPLYAQSFDLAHDRLPLTSLDGLWHFQTGDDPAWAAPDFNDSKWPLLRSDQDWAKQGYQGYSGIAWYRFQLLLPAGSEQVSISLPEIETCYQVYADGKFIGSYGKMPPNTKPYAGGGRFHVYALPPGPHTARTVHIALRVWHYPGWAMNYGGGPAAGGGLAGDSSAINQQQDLERARLHWWLTSFQTVALLQTMAGLGSLALFALRRKEREYLWFSLAMLFSAASGWIDFNYALQPWNLYLRDVAEETFTAATYIALLAFYFTLFKPRRNPLFFFAALCLAATPFVTLYRILHEPAVNIWVNSFIEYLLTFPFLVWVVALIVDRVRQASLDARLLLLPVILSTSVTMFENAAWANYVPGTENTLGLRILIIDKPFPIDLSQITDVLFLLSMLAILIIRFTATRTQEEHFGSEVNAARDVQQYLIPETIPNVAGLDIKSEYRPAREVGGDFFQILPHASDGSVLIVVGDVAGHGLEAGMLATLMVGAIRTAAMFTTDPETLMTLLNDRMHGRGLATCVTLCIQRDGRIALSSAGHPPPYLNGTPVAVEGSLPLGVVPGMTYPPKHFRLAENDVIMLMTDGVAEATNENGKLFGFERIEKMLARGANAAAIADAAQRFGQEDDITVLTVKCFSA
ncbi:MAG: SpoIIE family protein phosphatase [Terracidiphilus sp.]